jgi:Domain of unknown function (DUF222)
MFDESRSLDPSALVGVVESVHRQESVLVARRLAAVAALLGYRTAAFERAESRDAHAVVDPFEQTAAEVAAAMNLSPLAAGYEVSDAEALDVRLPEVAALLAEGRTDWRTVRLVIRRSELVTDPKLVAQVDASLAERIGNWSGWSRQRIVNAVDAAVCAIDPDAFRERRDTAERGRYIGVSATDNGMAEVYGQVGATAAAAFDRRLSQLAKQVCASDPRTLDQRRADALGALAAGHALACACGRPGCPRADGTDGTGGAERGGAQVIINVIASQATVHGDSERPGYLEGYGVIDAEQVRAWAATGPRCGWRTRSPARRRRWPTSPARRWRARCAAGI